VECSCTPQDRRLLLVRIVSLVIKCFFGPPLRNIMYPRCTVATKINPPCRSIHGARLGHSQAADSRSSRKGIYSAFENQRFHHHNRTACDSCCPILTSCSVCCDTCLTPELSFDTLGFTITAGPHARAAVQDADESPGGFYQPHWRLCNGKIIELIGWFTIRLSLPFLLDPLAWSKAFNRRLGQQPRLAWLFDW
jgi:hypothetical protein